MKNYIRYKKLTPEEAENLTLREAKNVCVRDFHSEDWSPYGIRGISEDAKFPFVSAFDKEYQQAAIRTEVNPRDVPEGCAPLPKDKPWLAYLGTGETRSIEGTDEEWTALWFMVNSCWRNGMFFNMPEKYYAIDVRTEFAKKHFPQIVACFEDEPFMQADPFKLWWDNIHQDPPYFGETLEACRCAWDAAIKYANTK